MENTPKVYSPDALNPDEFEYRYQELVIEPLLSGRRETAEEEEMRREQVQALMDENPNLAAIKRAAIQERLAMADELDDEFAGIFIPTITE